MNLQDYRGELPREFVRFLWGRPLNPKILKYLSLSDLRESANLYFSGVYYNTTYVNPILLVDLENIQQKLLPTNRLNEDDFYIIMKVQEADDSILVNISVLEKWIQLPTLLRVLYRGKKYEVSINSLETDVRSTCLSFCCLEPTVEEDAVLPHEVLEKLKAERDRVYTHAFYNAIERYQYDSFQQVINQKIPELSINLKSLLRAV